MTTAQTVSREQVLAFRVAGHHLDERRPIGELVEVAAACGIRNTPPGSSALAFQARVADLPPGAVDDALAEEKVLVEVLCMRISPYIVPAPEAAVFTLGALPAGEESLRATLAAHLPTLKKAGVSATEALEQAAAAARAELEHGALSRGALSAGMTRRLPEALSTWCRACNARHIQESLFRLVGVRGAFVISRVGKSNVYVRTDQWLDAVPDGDPAEARAELLRRYLRCYGPSTVEHFAAWVGIGTAEARRSWDRMADQLVQVDLDGRRTWVHADDVARLENPPKSTGVRLLPGYDGYLDQRDRATLLPDKELHRRVWKTLGNPGVVLAAGEVVGTWRPQKKGKRLTVTVEAFAPLPRKARAEIEAEAALVAPHRGCSSADVAFDE
jgi:hypothetical protein